MIGVPDQKWGERPLVVIVLRAEFKGEMTGEDMKQYLKKMSEEGKLPKYGIPDRYEFVDAIPRTSVGKINKVELRKICAV